MDEYFKQLGDYEKESGHSETHWPELRAKLNRRRWFYGLRVGAYLAAIASGVAVVYSVHQGTGSPHSAEKSPCDQMEVLTATSAPNPVQENAGTENTAQVRSATPATARNAHDQTISHKSLIASEREDLPDIHARSAANTTLEATLPTATQANAAPALPAHDRVKRMPVLRFVANGPELHIRGPLSINLAKAPKPANALFIGVQQGIINKMHTYGWSGLARFGALSLVYRHYVTKRLGIALNPSLNIETGHALAYQYRQHDIFFNPVEREVFVLRDVYSIRARLSVFFQPRPRHTLDAGPYLNYVAQASGNEYASYPYEGLDPVHKTRQWGYHSLLSPYDIGLSANYYFRFLPTWSAGFNFALGFTERFNTDYFDYLRSGNQYHFTYQSNSPPAPKYLNLRREMSLTLIKQLK